MIKWELMTGLAAAMLISGIAVGESDQHESRRLVEQGKILPLQQILDLLGRERAGRVLEVELERELNRGRLAGQDLSTQRFDPTKEMQDLIAVLQQVHRDKGVSVQYQVDELVEPFGDREDMLELLGNLLDNACKWAVSKVVCRIEGGEQIAILVEDDGAGLKDDDIQYPTRRGSRLDENVEGHGLGLAIVGDIVKLYGGSISYSRSPKLHGLSVQIFLPRSRDKE